MKRRPLGSNDRRLLANALEIIGIDEVGRGCLAGPVVVGGAVYRRIPRNPLIQDSKTLSPVQRAEAARWIRTHCERWLITEVWVDIIDRLNILEATRLAMQATARVLAGSTAVVVVDQIELADVACPVVSTPAADGSYFAVASASILAKVHRDRVMADLALRHALWQWDRNKGYGTLEHRRALQQNGRSYLHRKTFRWSPVLT